MKKKGFMAMMGIVVTMVMVVVVALSTKTSADACSFFKKENVNFYIGNANADGFNVQVIKTRLTPKKLIKTLQKQGQVASGVKVRGFVDNGTSLVLNLSQAYADDVSNAGTSGEYIKVGSVVNTFLDAYDAENILITVEGNSWSTGHVEYSEPLTMFSSNQTSDEPVVEDTTTLNIYVSNENADGFNTKEVQIEELTAENVIKALQAEGAVADGVTVKSFRDIETNLILDLSSEFAADICNSGSAGEYVKVGCVVNTFLEAFNSSEILITVEGEPWESGHVIYDNTLTKFN